jgi:hypothetical protein
MAKLPEGRSTLTDEQMIGLTHRLVDTCIDCKGRIEELEAKLEKAVDALAFYGDERHYEGEYIADECGCCGSWYEPKIHKDGQDSGDKARTTLAELTGGKDAE